MSAASPRTSEDLTQSPDWFTLDHLEADGLRRLLLQGDPRHGLPGCGGRLWRVERDEVAQRGRPLEWMVLDGQAARVDPAHEVQAAERIERAHDRAGWFINVAEWHERFVRLAAWIMASRCPVAVAWLGRPYEKDQMGAGLLELSWHVERPRWLGCAPAQICWETSNEGISPAGTAHDGRFLLQRFNLPTLWGRVQNGPSDAVALALALQDAGRV